MKLQPESKKELTRIACGTAICTAVMWVIFAALHLVGWVKFDYTVVLGSLIGAAVAIGNFAGICIVCQKVIDEQDENGAKRHCRLPTMSGCFCRRCGSSCPSGHPASSPLPVFCPCFSRALRSTTCK